MIGKGYVPQANHKAGQYFLRDAQDFLTMRATRDINHEAAGRTRKLESSNQHKFVEYYILYIHYKLYCGLGTIDFIAFKKFQASLELDSLILPNVN